MREAQTEGLSRMPGKSGCTARLQSPTRFAGAPFAQGGLYTVAATRKGADMGLPLIL